MYKKDVALKVDGLNIIGQLYLPDGGFRYPTICVCHGIPSGISDPDDRGYPELAERLQGQGFAVLIFNFRGAGASAGNLDILGWTRDLTAAIDYLYRLPEVDRTHLSLLGFSGGAAVSMYIAAQDKRVSAVATCACPAEFNLFTELSEPRSLIDHFRNIGAIRDDDFPYSAEEWFDGFDVICPIKYVDKISPRPLLLVHGSKDDLVNVSHAYRLYEKASEPKQINIVDGAGHRLRRDERAVSTVIEWLKSL